MTHTYLFYDTETTGLNICCDQVMQFAAIRTDLALHEIERVEFKVKLNPDVIPSPYALLTHRISIHDCNDGLSEYEAAKKIHALFNQPNTISIGYNTLNFDDELLRFTFFRNLLTPYTHQYANGCSRMDIYPCVVFYYLYHRDFLNWPSNDEGVVNLKLENLATANQLEQLKAHDALSDVEATIALARKLQMKQQSWDYVRRYFNKNQELERLHKLDRMALMINGRLGAKQHYQAPVINLGQHYHYRNQTVWLRLDDDKLTATTRTNIPNNTWVFRKKLTEPPFLLPLTTKTQRHLSEERLQLAEQNYRWLQAQPELLKDIKAYYLNYTYPSIENLDPDAALYEAGFPSDLDQRLCAQFHNADLHQKQHIVERLESPYLTRAARRLLSRNYFNCAPDEDHREALVNYRLEKRYTAADALQDIAQLRNQTLDHEQQQLLQELEGYCK